MFPHSSPSNQKSKIRNSLSRLFQPPPSITVTRGADGAPAAFRWAGRHHAVSQVVRRWRVDVAWWEEHARRDCYQLLTETGLLVEVAHDLARDEWLLVRLYD